MKVIFSPRHMPMSAAIASLASSSGVTFPQLLWLRKFAVASHAPKGHIRAATENFLKLLVREWSLHETVSFANGISTVSNFTRGAQDCSEKPSQREAWFSVVRLFLSRDLGAKACRTRLVGGEGQIKTSRAAVFEFGI